MKRIVDWQTRTKLLSAFGLVLLCTVLITVASLLSLHRIESARDLTKAADVVAEQLIEVKADENRVRVKSLLLLLATEPQQAEQLEREMREVTREVDTELNALDQAAAGSPALQDHLRQIRSSIAGVREHRSATLAAFRGGQGAEAVSLALGPESDAMEDLRQLILAAGDAQHQVAKDLLEASDRTGLAASRLVLGVGSLSVVLALLMVVLLNRGIAAPLVALTKAVGAAARGELSVELQLRDRQDEVGRLSTACQAFLDAIRQATAVFEQIVAGDLTDRTGFLTDGGLMSDGLQQMTNTLRTIVGELSQGVGVVGTSASQILTTTTQVAASASETATAVSETTTTVEEVRQTAELASQKAQGVMDSSRRASEVAQNGLRALEETSQGMDQIRRQMSQISDSAVQVSEQSRLISQIAETVTDVADQSNLLAVNAAIEAAKAGEQGRGFAVVAQEIRSLAVQAKEAVAQVRTILEEVQEAVNRAVMATDQGTRAVESGTKLVADSGEVLRQLAETVAEAAEAASQISASSQQQMAGMNQIAPAMENIKQASEQNVTGTQQAQQAAQSLHELVLQPRLSQNRTVGLNRGSARPTGIGFASRSLKPRRRSWPARKCGCSRRTVVVLGQGLEQIVGRFKV